MRKFQKIMELELPAVHPPCIPSDDEAPVLAAV